MKPIVATLLMLSLVTAGCTSDGAESDLLTSDAGSDDNPATSQPQDGGGADQPATGGNSSAGNGTTSDDTPETEEPNTPPTAALQANVTEIVVPADVQFTLEGSDADADTLSWTLDVDGDGVADSEGTTLPFNFTFSYTTAGNYTVTFNLTDGEASVSETLVVEATEPVAEEVPGEPDLCSGPDPAGSDVVPGQVYAVEASDGLEYYYRESNGIAGLQRTTAEAPVWGWNDPDGTCADGDTMIY